MESEGYLGVSLIGFNKAYDFRVLLALGFHNVTLRISSLLANMFLKIFSVDADLEVKKKCPFMANERVGRCFSLSGFKSMKRLVTEKL